MSRNLIANAASMMVVLEDIARAAAAWTIGSRLVVLLLGESGVGKTLIASRIAALAGLALTSRDVAALSTEQLCDCLFGHRRGAFTGALDARRGACESADGGVLLLDEIGEMDSDGQKRLLEVIDTGDYLPLGESRKRHSDICWIVATNRDLWADVEAGRFREDLYWRLAGIMIDVPPLRERREDIPEIAAEIARTLRVPATLAPGCDAVLRAHDWQGNAREMENVLDASAAASEFRVIRPAQIQAQLLRRSRGRRRRRAGVLSCPNRAQAIRDHLRVFGQITRADVQRITGAGQTASYETILSMLASEEIEPRGVNRMTYYVLSHTSRREHGVSKTRGGDGDEDDSTG